MDRKRIKAIPITNVGIPACFDTVDGPASHVPPETIVRQGLKQGGDRVFLCGGEPIMHPKILKIIKALHKAGKRVSLVTYGLGLSDDSITQRLSEAGLSGVIMVIPGVNPILYRKLCGLGDWEQLIRALKNLKVLDIKVDFAIPGDMGNLVNITAIMGLVEMFGNPKITLFYPTIRQKGNADLHPKLETFAQAADSMAMRYKNVYVHGIPACFPMDKAKTEIVEDCPLFSPTRHLPACNECRDRDICPGIPVGYDKLHGTPIHGPFVTPISSSFDFVETGEKLQGEPIRGSCFARKWQGDPVRHVFVRNGGAWQVYKTDTRDFSGNQIAEIVKRAGQLYLDQAKGPSLKDFARELTRLTLMESCRGCDELATCPGCFVPAKERAFKREVELVKCLIRNIKGRILDIGAGEGYYADVINGLIAQGLIKYHALDPDEQALAELLSKTPDATVHVGGVEDVFLGPARFDAIVAVRSINHFKSLHHGLSNIFNMLKVDGTLILTDGLAIPVIRTKEQANAAHVAKEGGFQHYRNLSSNEVVRLLERYGFQVVEHHPVTRDTSDEWVVRAIKRERLTG